MLPQLFMQLISLDQVFKILKPGVPLPFGVRDVRGQLLLAKGHVVSEQAKLLELLNRGMYVDADEVRHVQAGGRAAASVPPQENFSTRWEALQRRLGLLLRGAGEPDFLKRIDEVAAQMAAFAEHDNDQIIFLIVRHDHTRYEQYAESHSLHTAALCHLVSRRLGWPEARRHSLIGAALTMNLSMANLQAKLAGQRTAPTLSQRKEIEAHPLESAARLRAAGLRDAEWLQAVEQHHERPGGSGYPRRQGNPGEASQVVRWCDIFAAKHSPRAGRTPQPPHQAARNLYEESAGHPAAAALIKECGIYPPGTYVKLAGGELAVVTRRGASAKEPVVAAIVNVAGAPLSRPVRRETSASAHAIVGVVPESQVRVRVSAQQLYD